MKGSKIDIHYNYGPGASGTTTQRRPKSNLSTFVDMVGLRSKLIFNILFLSGTDSSSEGFPLATYSSGLRAGGLLPLQKHLEFIEQEYPYRPS